MNRKASIVVALTALAVLPPVFAQTATPKPAAIARRPPGRPRNRCARRQIARPPSMRMRGSVSSSRPISKSSSALKSIANASATDSRPTWRPATKRAPYRHPVLKRANEHVPEPQDALQFRAAGDGLVEVPHVSDVANAGIAGDRYFDAKDEPGQNITLAEAAQAPSAQSTRGCLSRGHSSRSPGQCKESRRGASRRNGSPSAAGRSKVRVRFAELVRRMVPEPGAERCHDEAWTSGGDPRPANGICQEVSSGNGDAG